MIRSREKNYPLGVLKKNMEIERKRCSTKWRNAWRMHRKNNYISVGLRLVVSFLRVRSHYRRSWLRHWGRMNWCPTGKVVSALWGLALGSSMQASPHSPQIRSISSSSSEIDLQLNPTPYHPYLANHRRIHRMNLNIIHGIIIYLIQKRCSVLFKTEKMFCSV